jgi:hypothetical protein
MRDEKKKGAKYKPDRMLLLVMAITLLVLVIGVIIVIETDRADTSKHAVKRNSGVAPSATPVSTGSSAPVSGPVGGPAGGPASEEEKEEEKESPDVAPVDSTLDELKAKLTQGFLVVEDFRTERISTKANQGNETYTYDHVMVVKAVSGEDNVIVNYSIPSNGVVESVSLASGSETAIKPGADITLKVTAKKHSFSFDAINLKITGKKLPLYFRLPDTKYAQAPTPAFDFIRFMRFETPNSKKDLKAAENIEVQVRVNVENWKEAAVYIYYDDRVLSVEPLTNTNFAFDKKIDEKYKVISFDVDSVNSADKELVCKMTVTALRAVVNVFDHLWSSSSEGELCVLTTDSSGGASILKHTRVLLKQSDDTFALRLPNIGFGYADAFSTEPIAFESNLFAAAVAAK